MRSPPECNQPPCSSVIRTGTHRVLPDRGDTGGAHGVRRRTLLEGGGGLAPSSRGAPASTSISMTSETTPGHGIHHPSSPDRDGATRHGECIATKPRSTRHPWWHRRSSPVLRRAARSHGCPSFARLVRTSPGPSTTAPIRRHRRVRRDGSPDREPLHVLPQRQPEGVVDQGRHAPTVRADGPDPAREPHLVAPGPARPSTKGIRTSLRWNEDSSRRRTGPGVFRPPYGYVNARAGRRGGDRVHRPTPGTARWPTQAGFEQIRGSATSGSRQAASSSRT